MTLSEDDRKKFLKSLEPKDFNCKTLTVFDIDPVKGDVGNKPITIGGKPKKGGKK